MGEERRGWHSFYKLIKEFSPNTQSHKFIATTSVSQQQKPSTSYCDVLKTGEVQKKTRLLQVAEWKGTSPSIYSHANPNLDSFIIVFRKYFHDDWFIELMKSFLFQKKQKK